MFGVETPEQRVRDDQTEPFRPERLSTGLRHHPSVFGDQKRVTVDELMAEGSERVHPAATVAGIRDGGDEMEYNTAPLVRDEPPFIHVIRGILMWWHALSEGYVIYMDFNRYRFDYRDFTAQYIDNN